MSQHGADIGWPRKLAVAGSAVVEVLYLLIGHQLPPGYRSADDDRLHHYGVSPFPLRHKGQAVWYR
jgi:hypothetical protein